MILALFGFAVILTVVANMLLVRHLTSLRRFLR